jgi:hypothetical protein
MKAPDANVGARNMIDLHVRSFKWTRASGSPIGERPASACQAAVTTTAGTYRLKR